MVVTTVITTLLVRTISTYVSYGITCKTMPFSLAISGISSATTPITETRVSPASLVQMGRLLSTRGLGVTLV